jgi:vacuolar protein sorting-associated protein 26
MYLTPYDLTPTYRNVHNKFSVRYSLNLVLVDQVGFSVDPCVI